MAYVNVCKQILPHKGERVPCVVDGREIIMWAAGGEPRAYDALCPP